MSYHFTGVIFSHGFITLNMLSIDSSCFPWMKRIYHCKMAGYWPRSLFALLQSPTWSRSKENLANEIAWSVKDLLYGIKNTEKNDLRTCLFSSTEKSES